MKKTNYEVYTCFDCIHGKFVAGTPQTYWEPGEPDHIECTLEFSEEMYDKFDEVYNDEHELPKICGKFEPILVEKCDMCRDKMNQPRYSCRFYVYEEYTDDAYYFCSQDCEDAFKVKEKFDEILDPTD